MKLSAVQERWLRDAIRNAYEAGYDDARTHGAKTGDDCPGWRGFEIERDTGRHYADAMNRCADESNAVTPNAGSNGPSGVAAKVRVD
jgi:hypothetical protein